MTSDGVNGTAADGHAGAEAPGLLFIKRDDGRLMSRYIGPAYPHTPAGGDTPDFRRERQVASALRTRTDFIIANSNCGAAGKSEKALAEMRPRQPRPVKRLR